MNEWLNPQIKKQSVLVFYPRQIKEFNEITDTSWSHVVNFQWNHHLPLRWLLSADWLVRWLLLHLPDTSSHGPEILFASQMNAFHCVFYAQVPSGFRRCVQVSQSNPGAPAKRLEGKRLGQCTTKELHASVWGGGESECSDDSVFFQYQIGCVKTRFRKTGRTRPRVVSLHQNVFYTRSYPSVCMVSLFNQVPSAVKVVS